MAQFNQLQTSASQVVNPPADFLSFHFDENKKLNYFDESGPLVVSASVLAISSSLSEQAIQLRAGEINYTGSFNISGSLRVHGNTILSGTLTVTESLNSPEISASFFSGSKADITEVSASTVSVLTGSFDNLTVLGTASIKYLDVQYETASHIFLTGSTRFGDEAGVDTHTFTGSVGITGSFVMDTASFATIPNLASGTLSRGIIGIVSGSGSFSGSGANLYDISASAIVGLNLSRIASASFTASLIVTSGSGSGSFQVNVPTAITGGLTVDYASGSGQTTGSNIYGTASWAVDSLFGAPAVVVSGSYPNTQRNIPTGSASGSLWWNTEDGNLYIQVANPTGSVWVPSVTSVPASNYGATLVTTQATASVTWSISHNLGTTTPIVQVYTGSQMIIPATIKADGSNSVELTFATASAGTVVISTGVGGPTSASFAVMASDLQLARTASYATDAEASSSGVPLYGIYRSGSFVKVRIV